MTLNSAQPARTFPFGAKWLVFSIALISSTLSAHPEPVTTAKPLLYATQITHNNAKQLVQRGPDASGGIGDWLLTNGTLCAVISNVDHESDLSVKGGVLIDLGYCGRDDDQFVAAQDLIDASRNSPLDIDRVDIAIGEHSAAIITYGQRGSIVVETRYTLDLLHTERLKINKQIRRVSDSDNGLSVYLSIGFNYHSMEVFVLSSRNLQRSNGFHQEEFVDRGPSALDRTARHADTIITISPRNSIMPISYGWRLKSAVKLANNTLTQLPFFVLADSASTAFLILSNEFYIGSADQIGILQMMQVALMELDVGESMIIEEEIRVSKRSDVASITDQLFPGEKILSGRVLDAGAVAHLDFVNGTPFSHIHPDERGDFSVRTPPGEYRLRVVAPGGRESITQLSMQNKDLHLGTINVAPPARILLPQGEAMRLVFKGKNNTSDPDLHNPLTGYSVTDDNGQHIRRAVSSVFLAGIPSDRKFIDLPPGEYAVYATRGIEYSLEKTNISVAEGEDVPLSITPPHRVIQSKGYIAADLHVHSSPGMDSSLSTVERLRTFVAEHGEVMVATEHDTIFSFHKLVKELGLTGSIITVTGTEMTSEVPTARLPSTIGHANFFPLTPDPLAYRRGAPNGEGRRARELLHEMQRKNPDIVSQLNHARDSLALSGDLPENFADVINSQNYLDHMGPALHPYQPDKPLNSFPNNTLIDPDPVTGVRDIDYDVMELMNGAQDRSKTRVPALRKDWFSFLKQGIRIVGSANSDSHTLKTQVGMPRNMVGVKDDAIENFNLDEFTSAIKKGNMYGTTGPLFELSLAGKTMGETAQLSRGQLTGKVVTADWVDARTISVQVNGETLEEKAITGDGTFFFDLVFAADAFVTIEVTGEPGEDYQVIYPQFKPYAFSNPIYVDADGDGKWSAPGL